MNGGYIARTAVRGFLLAAIAALGAACAVALGPVAPAAAAPSLVIESPPSGSATNDQTPTISGTTTGSGPVTVNIYRGASAEGTPEQSPSDPLALGGSWSVTPARLEEGPTRRSPNRPTSKNLKREPAPPSPSPSTPPPPRSR